MPEKKKVRAWAKVDLVMELSPDDIAMMTEQGWTLEQVVEDVLKDRLSRARLDLDQIHEVGKL